MAKNWTVFSVCSGCRIQRLPVTLVDFVFVSPFDFGLPGVFLFSDNLHLADLSFINHKIAKKLSYLYLHILKNNLDLMVCTWENSRQFEEYQIIICNSYWLNLLEIFFLS